MHHHCNFVSWSFEISDRRNSSLSGTKQHNERIELVSSPKQRRYCFPLAFGIGLVPSINTYSFMVDRSCTVFSPSMAEISRRIVWIVNMNQELKVSVQNLTVKIIVSTISLLVITFSYLLVEILLCSSACTVGMDIGDRNLQRLAAFYDSFLRFANWEWMSQTMHQRHMHSKITKGSIQSAAACP